MAAEAKSRGGKGGSQTGGRAEAAAKTKIIAETAATAAAERPKAEAAKEEAENRRPIRSSLLPKKKSSETQLPRRKRRPKAEAAKEGAIQAGGRAKAACKSK